MSRDTNDTLSTENNMKTISKMFRLAPIVLLVGGLAACSDTATTGPDVSDLELDELTSVLRNSTLAQVDRMGFPAINTAVVIDDAAKDAFNAAAPSQFADFIPFAVSQLEAFYAVPPANGEVLASLLLPDILTVGGPVFVGREPSDDVIDAILGTLFGPGGLSALAPYEPLASDNVDSNDLPFPSTFPYLAAPHGG